jgi:hypothetical protein
MLCSPAPYLYDLLSAAFIQGGFRRGSMKANLSGVSNRQALIPKRGHRPVHDVIVRRQMRSPTVVGCATSAIVNQTPEIVGIEIASCESESLQSC